MIFGMQFATFRWIVLSLAVFAQIYLYVRARQAISRSRRSDRFKSRAVILVGAGIALLFVVNMYIMFRPLPWIDPPTAAQIGLFYPPAVWSLGSLFAALLLGLTQVAGGLRWMGARLYRGLAGKSISGPADPGRRRFLQASVGGLAATPFILCGYGAAYAGRAYEIEELTLPFGRSLRVVQLTDIHAGIYMNRDEMRRYAAQAMALQPDLFVLTGDYISNSLVFLSGCLEEMGRIRARYGTFATLGNHEHWYADLAELQAIFREYRIPLLHNSHQLIETEGGSFAVAGIDDLRTGYPDLEAALRGLDSATPTLLLSHRPEIFPEAAQREIPLTLAGHYHGGQVKLSLPGGGLSLAHLRTPYAEGLYRINTSHLYVSRGIGTTFTPVRLNAPPEVTLFHLT